MRVWTMRGIRGRVVTDVLRPSIIVMMFQSLALLTNTSTLPCLFFYPPLPFLPQATPQFRATFHYKCSKLSPLAR
jgi:hypothetical protein